MIKRYFMRKRGGAENEPGLSGFDFPLRLCVSFFLVIFFVSCATSPKAGPELEDGSPDFSLLPSGANLYLWADIARAKPLLEVLPLKGMSAKNTSQIIERTDTVLAAFYSNSDSRRFFLAAWGNFPNLRAGVSMNFSKGWKRVKSGTGKRYWYSSGNKLGIAVGPKVAFVSDGDPFSQGQGTDPTPRGFEEFRRPCAISGWVNNPGDLINRFILNLGIPLQIPAEDLYFGAVRNPSNTVSGDKEPWELVLSIRTPSASQARSLVSLFAFARIFVQRGGLPEGETGAGGSSMSPMDAAALFFANPPEQNGEFLTLRIRSLSEERIALLFNMFSVYSSSII